VPRGMLRACAPKGPSYSFMHLASMGSLAAWVPLHIHPPPSPVDNSRTLVLCCNTLSRLSMALQGSVAGAARGNCRRNHSFQLQQKAKAYQRRVACYSCHEQL